MNNLTSLQTSLSQLVDIAEKEITNANDINALEQIKIRYLSKKGTFTQYMQMLNSAPAEMRPNMGKIVNAARSRFQQLLQEKHETLKKAALEKKLTAESIDISLPGRTYFRGSYHPITLTRLYLESWFGKLGFVVRNGPEIEDDFHNFTALNIPPHHPARAMQDTFYFDEQTVLRTQTSNVQIHTLENEPLPIRMIAPGRVYRSDSDMTHSPMFHQCEGLVVDDHATFAELKGLIVHFLRDFFADDALQIRFRPSFFPFTEPSAEVDIAFLDESGERRWLEVLGCGMVHPNVLNSVNIDSKRYQGYAFGMGLERLAMLRYGIRDLRMFFDNDIRFLCQFQH